MLRLRWSSTGAAEKFQQDRHECRNNLAPDGRVDEAVGIELGMNVVWNLNRESLHSFPHFFHKLFQFFRGARRTRFQDCIGCFPHPHPWRQATVLPDLLGHPEMGHDGVPLAMVDDGLRPANGNAASGRR